MSLSFVLLHALAHSFEKAAQYPQVYPKTLNNLATMYFKLGHNDAAEKWFLESIRLNPDQANVYSNLGSLYGMTNRPQQAENMFKQAIAVNPNYVEGYFNLGTLLVQNNRPEDSELYLRKALELNPRHTGAANNLKVALYDKQLKEQTARQQPMKSNVNKGKKKKQ
jgi:tetratricopeptide (TPR) repeat protein